MSARAKKAGVIGWPVSHSLSPALHRYWLEAYGIDGTYEAIAVEPTNLAETLCSLQDQGFAGLNVTVPHKEAVAPLMDHLDPVAEVLGAVNLLVFDQNGSRQGFNTDGQGFLENVKAAVPDAELKGRRAVVLGAGGTAKAVAYALLQVGAQVTLANRTVAKAQALAQMLGPTDIVPWAEREAACEGAALVVNTTTLGMTGQPDLSMDLGALLSDAIVADCVYAPLETPLLKRARERGLMAVDGLGMLIHQARPAFKAWFGVEPEVTPELRDHLLKAREGLGS
jgi:shikimate dehydrogenase